MPKSYGRKSGKKALRRVEINVTEAEFALLQERALAYAKTLPNWKPGRKPQIGQYLRNLARVDCIRNGLDWPHYDYSKGGDYLPKKGE
jgi:hypothetical protein